MVLSLHKSKKKEGCAADFLMRCNHNRTVYLENKKTSTLFQELKKTKSLGKISFELEVDGVVRIVVQNIYALTATVKSADGGKTVSINSFCLEEIEPPESPPNMGTMMGYITQLGGHQKCKNSLEAGIKALWVGLSALGNYADAWDLFGPEVDHRNELFVKKRCA